MECLEIALKSKTKGSVLSRLKSTHSATLGELENYKLLVDSVEDYAIFMLDPEGIIQTWNKGAQKNKGWTAEEIIGQHFSIFYLPSDKEAQKPERELKLARRLGRVEDEDWRVRKDGSQFWANVVITALRDETGKLVGFAKVTRDLTERKRNEDLLRSSNALLKKQQRELELLNVTKDEFISLASHQLRTPATAVKQLLGMLTQGFMGDVPPKQLELITRAYNANERQIRIVENLLKVAHLDAGKVVLRLKQISLPEYLADVVEEYTNIVLRKNQTLNLNIKDITKNIVSIDADQFRMALGNLIDNASKYTSDGGKISVSAQLRGTTLHISVEDNGVGINPSDQKLLFKKFSRIPNDLSEKVGGSGLGLYWVKRVVEMHNGTVEVQSTPHQGSIFTIKLPAETSNA